MAKRGRKPRNKTAANARLTVRFTDAELAYIKRTAEKYSTLSDTAGTADFWRAATVKMAKAIESGQLDINNIFQPGGKDETRET